MDILCAVCCACVGKGSAHNKSHDLCWVWKVRLLSTISYTMYNFNLA